ncbi:MAG TPA: protein-L-isoaspartate(D-aspartate) O-methyltransferase [Candidatus Binatia bacterium]
MVDRTQERNRMVREQLAQRGIADRAVLAAFSAIPRELFVPRTLASRAYEDCALPIACGQTISQPFVVAYMFEALALTGRERVLEVGTGSGYSAAILSHVARTVFSVERFARLAASAERRLHRLGIVNVHVSRADGTLGLASEAPFDAIVVAAGAREVPQPLVDQLIAGGRLVMPVGGDGEFQSLMRITRSESGGVSEEDLGQCRFVPLVAGTARR